MRRKVVAGNWKMNMTPSEAVALVKKLKPNMENSDVDVIFCVPSIEPIQVRFLHRCWLMRVYPM